MDSIERFKAFVTEGITVGDGVPAGPLTLFPLSHHFPPSDHMLYQDAHARGLVKIEETSESGTVGELRVTNHGGQPLLLLEGEVLLGLKQTRVLNATILVPGLAVLTVPVSCVEVGRWHHVSAASIGKGSINLSPRVRAAKTASVTRSARANGRYASDQAAVWDGVASVLADQRVDAPTGSYSDLARERGADILSRIRDVRPHANQSGVLACLGGTPLCLDLFDGPETLSSVWEALIGSYSTDAGFGTGNPGKLQGRTPTLTFAIRWIKGVAKGDIVSSPSIGLGTSVTSISPRVEAAGLIYEERLVHLAAFPVQIKTTPTSFVSPSRRRA